MVDKADTVQIVLVSPGEYLLVSTIKTYNAQSITMGASNSSIVLSIQSQIEGNATNIVGTRLSYKPQTTR